MIYFDNKKQAYGYKIDNYIATVEDDIWVNYAGTDKWDIVDGIFTDITDKEEYKEKKEKELQEIISHLKCTKRVLALMLQQLGISYSQLKALIATSEQAQLEWDLCVELERCNPLLDIFGEQLGISPEQIDQMFKYANGWVDILEVE